MCCQIIEEFSLKRHNRAVNYLQAILPEDVYSKHVNLRCSKQLNSPTPLA